MREPNSRRFTVRRPSELLWREWDGEFVVFHPATADTHLLNPAAARILRRLEELPSTLEELVAHSGAGSAASVERLVEELDELGLIEPVEP